MVRVDGEIYRSDVFWILRRCENFFPVSSAVRAAVDAAVRIGFVDVAEGRYVDAVRIGRINDNFADLACLREANGAPGFAGVSRFEQADAIRVLTANVGFTGADVDDIGIGWSYGDSADGAYRDSSLRAVRNRKPGAAGVFGLPYPAADGAHVEGVGLGSVTGHAIGASAAHGADVTPLKAVEHLRGILLSGCGNRGKECERSGTNKAYCVHENAPKCSGFCYGGEGDQSSGCLGL